MKKVAETLAWFVTNKKGIATLIVLLGSLVTAISSLTPSEKDDEVADKINKTIDTLGIDDVASEESAPEETTEAPVENGQ